VGGSSGDSGRELLHDGQDGGDASCGMGFVGRNMR